MWFRCYEAPWHGAAQAGPTVKWAKYVCRNCGGSTRTFGLLFEVELDGPDKGWHIMKIGEYPPFGPPTPARLVTLVEEEREQFFKGRRCETQGLGIGAYGYYRRVVVSQRDRLLDAIITAAERTNAAADKVEQLKRAKTENRFKESMALAEEALPESLFINGHNPLKVLHNALSEGLHELTDEQCLARAEAARVVLSALAERLAEVSKEQADLAAALHKLTTKGGGQS